ncbi:hypothetical protein M885DRAFT_505423 [Pelagophyceae sp. CCMP2097]|nr:hypothetical protein M885DRAFT_505423 [Pelagophyceae sp. CCMP2097]
MMRAKSAELRAPAERSDGALRPAPAAAAARPVAAGASGGPSAGDAVYALHELYPVPALGILSPALVRGLAADVDAQWIDGVDGTQSAGSGGTPFEQQRGGVDAQVAALMAARAATFTPLLPTRDDFDSAEGWQAAFKRVRRDIWRPIDYEGGDIARTADSPWRADTTKPELFFDVKPVPRAPRSKDVARRLERKLRLPGEAPRPQPPESGLHKQRSLAGRHFRHAPASHDAEVSGDSERSLRRSQRESAASYDTSSLIKAARRPSTKPAPAAPALSIMAVVFTAGLIHKKLRYVVDARPTAADGATPGRPGRLSKDRLSGGSRRGDSQGRLSVGSRGSEKSVRQRKVLARTHTAASTIQAAVRLQQRDRRVRHLAQAVVQRVVGRAVPRVALEMAKRDLAVLRMTAVARAARKLQRFWRYHTKPLRLLKMMTGVVGTVKAANKVRSDLQDRRAWKARIAHRGNIEADELLAFYANGDAIFARAQAQDADTFWDRALDPPDFAGDCGSPALSVLRERATRPQMRAAPSARHVLRRMRGAAAARAARPQTPAAPGDAAPIEATVLPLDLCGSDERDRRREEELMQQAAARPNSAASFQPRPPPGWSLTST